MYHFFAFMNRMKYIERWSLMRSIRKENIMEHSEQVAMIAHALCIIGNTYFGKNYNADKIGMIAAYHEAGEVITGDLPTPIKYFNPKIKTAYKELEADAEIRLINMLPKELKDMYKPYITEVTDEEHFIMKCADKIGAYIKCVEELKAGNSEFSKAEKTIKKDILAMNSQEANYFMENFIPSYSLTLDELDN